MIGLFYRYFESVNIVVLHVNVGLVGQLWMGSQPADISPTAYFFPLYFMRYAIKLLLWLFYEIYITWMFRSFSIVSSSVHDFPKC